MPCSITLTAQSLDCSPNIGGLKAVWLANRADVKVISNSPTDNKVKLDKADAATNPVFKKIGVRSGISSLTSTAQVSEENNTLYYRDEAAVVVNKLTQTLVALIKRIPSGDVVVVAEDMNGNKWALGFDVAVTSNARIYPVTVAGSVLETGTAKTDRNGGTLTLACEHPGPLVALDSTTSASLFSN